MSQDRGILMLGAACQQAILAAAALARGDEQAALEALYFVGVNYRCGIAAAGYTERELEAAGRAWTARWEHEHPSGYQHCPGCGESRCDGSCVEPPLEEDAL